MKKQAIILTRMTEARTVGEYLPLKAISVMPEKFRWREDEEMEEGRLQSLYDSMIVNGQEEPVEVADLEGKTVAIKGHRRLSVFWLMVERQVEGVTPDFPVLVKRVENATILDLVARSINDNVNRATLSEFGKVKGALALRDLGAREERVRVTIGISDTSLARYYRLGDNLWMWQHVLDNDLRITDAHALLEAALNHNRVGELQRELAVEVGRKKAQIAALEARRLEDRNEPLSASERWVKNHIEPHEMETWIASVKQTKPIGPGSKWVYRAAIVEKKGHFTLVIPALSVKLVAPEVERVRTTRDRLKKVLRDLEPHLKRLEAEVEISRAQEAERSAEATTTPAPQLAEPTPAPATPPTSEGGDPAFGRTKIRQLTDPLGGVEIPDAPSSGSEEAKS
jgi:hypothetical protein